MHYILHALLVALKYILISIAIVLIVIFLYIGSIANDFNNAKIDSILIPKEYFTFSIKHKELFICFNFYAEADIYLSKFLSKKYSKYTGNLQWHLNGILWFFFEKFFFSSNERTALFFYNIKYKEEHGLESIAKTYFEKKSTN